MSREVLSCLPFSVQAEKKMLKGKGFDMDLRLSKLTMFVAREEIEGKEYCFVVDRETGQVDRDSMGERGVPPPGLYVCESQKGCFYFRFKNGQEIENITREEFEGELELFE